MTHVGALTGAVSPDHLEGVANDQVAGGLEVYFPIVDDETPGMAVHDGAPTCSAFHRLSQQVPQKPSLTAGDSQASHRSSRRGGGR